MEAFFADLVAGHASLSDIGVRPCLSSEPRCSEVDASDASHPGHPDPAMMASLLESGIAESRLSIQGSGACAAQESVPRGHGDAEAAVQEMDRGGRKNREKRATVKMVVAYHGACFGGFQTQEGELTVQR